MAEAVQKSIIQEGIEIGILEGIEIGEARGEERGELKGKIQTILTFLHAKFHHVPDEVVIELNKRTDPTALDSLAVLSAQCKTLDEFTKVLK